MNEPAKPEPHPFEVLKDAMRQILTVPKAEILRREAEYKELRKARRETGAQNEQGTD